LRILSKNQQTWTFPYLLRPHSPHLRTISAV